MSFRVENLVEWVLSLWYWKLDQKGPSIASKSAGKSALFFKTFFKWTKTVQLTWPNFLLQFYFLTSIRPFKTFTIVAFSDVFFFFKSINKSNRFVDRFEQKKTSEKATIVNVLNDRLIDYNFILKRVFPKSLEYF